MQLISLPLTSLTVFFWFCLLSSTVSDCSPVFGQTFTFYTLFTFFFLYEQWSVWFGSPRAVANAAYISFSQSSSLAGNTFLFMLIEMHIYLINSQVQLILSHIWGFISPVIFLFRNIFNRDYLILCFFHIFPLSLIPQFPLSDADLNFKNMG